MNSLAWFTLSVPRLFACPVCESELGRQVRQGIFERDFASNLLRTLLPFLVFAVILAAVHFDLLAVVRASVTRLDLAGRLPGREVRREPREELG